MLGWRLKEIEEEERILLIRKKILDTEQRVAAQRQALEGYGNAVLKTVADVVHQQSASIDVEALPARKCTLGKESWLKVPDPSYYKGSGQREFTDWIQKVE